MFPFDTREHAIMDAISAYKSCITNKKFNTIAKFKLQFKSCHKSSQIFWITKAITPHYIRKDVNKKVIKTPIGFNIFPQKLMNKAKLRFNKKDKIWLNNNFPNYQLNNESKIQRECGNYYLIINFKQKILDIKKPNIVASLDPGIRTFMTMFDEKGSIGKFGQNYKELLNKLYIKIDNIRSNRAKYKFKKRKRYNMRRKEFKLHKKIKDIVSDLHNKSASYLVKNYNVILLPEFGTSKMVQNSNLHKSVKRDMLSLRFYNYKNKLNHLSAVYKTKLLIVNESYTSQTCTKCGSLNKIGSNKIYKCSKCSLKIDRDINGARNILIKSLRD